MKPAPFRIPREIKIRGKKWLVALDSELGDSDSDTRSRMELRGVLLGATYRESHKKIKREIHLSTHHKSDRELAQTFLHELIHACVPANEPAELTGAQEERFITLIESALFEALEQLEWK